MSAIALKSIQISDRKAIICRPSKKHLIARANLEPFSGKENSRIHRLFAADTLYFRMTTTAKEVKANTIFTGFNQLTETRSQFSILNISEFALKQTKLHPLSVGFENLVDSSTAAIFRNIVGND